MPRSRTAVSFGAILVSLAVRAAAEPGPATTPPPPDATAAPGAEQKPPPALPAAGAARPAQRAAPAAPYELVIAPAYQNLDISGSREDYYHYQRPPSGFFLNRLQFTHRDPAGSPLQEIWWRNLFETDQKGFVDVHGRKMPAYLRLWRDTTDYYGDPQLPGGAFSNRENTRVRLHLERRAPSPALDLYLWDQGVSIPASARFQPFSGVDYHAPQYALRAFTPLGKGQLYLEPSHLQFNNQTGRLPDSDTTWLTGEFVQPFGPRTDVSLAYDRVSTSVSGRETALWNIFRLQGSVRPTNSLAVDAFFRQQGINLPFTQTTYANRSSLAGVNIGAYIPRHSSLRGGLFHEEIRREDGSTGDTSHSAWTGGWARYRVSNRSLGTFSLRFKERDLNNAPRPQVSVLPSAQPLYYTRDRSIDARLDHPFGDRVNTYLLYGWRDRHNAERDTRLTLSAATIGANAQVSARISATAEYTLQHWNGDTTPLQAAGPPPGGIPPSLFFSDSDILTTTLLYQLDNHSGLDLTYNQFVSTGGQSARDHLAIVQYRREASRTFFYSIGLQYESFSDNRRDRDYHAFPVFFQIGLRRPF